MIENNNTNEPLFEAEEVKESNNDNIDAAPTAAEVVVPEDDVN